MRRLKNLFNAVTSHENLWLAWREFRAGKRSRPSVLAFELDIGSSLAALARQLGERTYSPGRYRLVFLREPKRRLIAAASVRDRVVHHAVHRIVAPLLEPTLIETTFACLGGRGSHRAVLAAWRAMRRFEHRLALDIRRYFPSIDRRILVEDVLGRQVDDPMLLDLLRGIAASGAGLYALPRVIDFLELEPGFPPAGCGLPIGNLTSQWWGNLYLSGLDHFVKRELKVPHYQRYMDDMTLFAHSRRELEVARAAIAAWLRRERRLELKHPDAAVSSTRARFGYLGYEVSRGGVNPGPKALGRFRRRMGQLLHEGDAETAERSVASYRGLLLPGAPRVDAP